MDIVLQSFNPLACLLLGHKSLQIWTVPGRYSPTITNQLQFEAQYREFYKRKYPETCTYWSFCLKHLTVKVYNKSDLLCGLTLKPRQTIKILFQYYRLVW